MLTTIQQPSKIPPTSFPPSPYFLETLFCNIYIIIKKTYFHSLIISISGTQHQSKEKILKPNPVMVIKKLFVVLLIANPTFSVFKKYEYNKSNMHDKHLIKNSESYLSALYD